MGGQHLESCKGQNGGKAVMKEAEFDEQMGEQEIE